MFGMGSVEKLMFGICVGLENVLDRIIIMVLFVMLYFWLVLMEWVIELYFWVILFIVL